ncbi:cobalamin B12-binding domain-containing protein [Nocardia sp. NPDC058518]|uniref:cobalamin B12-binding domain-containing protein n=1 Tax=Nocardia sp. NPDC058518 TaxID=3346534 RepID=UPI00364D0AA2
MNARFRCVLSTVESDSHIWNLVYLQKVLEEHGASVRNLGPCTPIDEVWHAVTVDQPDLLVVSSVNGHGYHGAGALLTALRARGLTVACVVGGKLTTAMSAGDQVRRELLALGYLDVFTSDDAIEKFRRFLNHGAVSGFSSWQAEAAVVPPWDSSSVLTPEVS